MRTNRILLPATLALLMLSAAPVAQAQGNARARGLDITLGLGMAGCTDLNCAGFDASAHVRMQILFRVIRHFAVGAHIGFQFADPDRNSPRWYDLGWSTVLGPEVRGILPVGKLEAWLGFTLGFMRQQINMENDDHNDIDRAWSNGLGLGIGFGAQYFLHPKVALGLDFWLYKGFFDEGCTYENDGDPREERCWDFNDDERAAIGVVFTFGFNVTFFLPM